MSDAIVASLKARVGILAASLLSKVKEVITNYEAGSVKYEQLHEHLEIIPLALTIT